MTPKEFKKSIKKANAIYGHVVLNRNMGEYLKIFKNDALELADKLINDENIDEINAEIYKDGALYIN